MHPIHHRVRFTIALALLVAPLIAQKQFAERFKRHFPADRDETLSLAIGDVDGDGDLDVVIGNAGQDRLVLNDGTGRYSEATPGHLPPTAYSTTSLILGDIDGDRDLDLVVASGDKQGLRIYLNDSKGRFYDHTSTHIPFRFQTPSALLLGDVDGDGDLDLVIANHGQRNSLLLNSGSGKFADVTTTHMPLDKDRTVSLVLGDVDGDGDKDLIVGNGGWGGGGGSNEQNRLYLNKGKGKFVDATLLHLPSIRDATSALALGDVDKDGDMDLIVGNDRQQNRLYLNNGQGYFKDATKGHMPVTHLGTTAFAMGDFDGDGDLDLMEGTAPSLSSAADDELDRLYLNDGKGRFRDVTRTRCPRTTDRTSVLVSGDVDGDGDVDIVVGSAFFRRSHLLLNDGSGSFKDASRGLLPELYAFSQAVAVGDVDGDGDPDLVFAKDTIRLYLNDGKGQFADATTGHVPLSSPVYWVTSLVLGDIDQDGDLDLLAGEGGTYTRGQNHLFVNDGKGVFTDLTKQRLPVLVDSTTSMALGDLDRDGDLDLIVGLFSGQNRLYLNNGKGLFKDATSGRLPLGVDETTSVVIGDVDGDGDLDLITGTTDTCCDSDKLFLNNGKGQFTDNTRGRLTGSFAKALVLGDVDADGDLDLIMTGNGTCLFLNDGKGNFTLTSRIRKPDFYEGRALALQDLDADGDPDLLLACGFEDKWSQSNGYYRLLLLNDGKGAFTDATKRLTSGGMFDTRAFACADLDADGDMDIVEANSWGATNHVYINHYRQVTTPYLAVTGRVYELDFHARPGFSTSFHLVVPFLAMAAKTTTLAPLGVFGLDPGRMIALPLMVVHPSKGKVTLRLEVPQQPNLRGKSLYCQALIFSDLQWPSKSLRFTNVTADRILR